MIGFEEAARKALAYNGSFDRCLEHERAYEFGWGGEMLAIGPHPLFIDKETGEFLHHIDARLGRLDLGEVVAEHFLEG